MSPLLAVAFQAVMGVSVASEVRVAPAYERASVAAPVATSERQETPNRASATESAPGQQAGPRDTESESDEESGVEAITVRRGARIEVERAEKTPAAPG